MKGFILAIVLCICFMAVFGMTANGFLNFVENTVGKYTSTALDILEVAGMHENNTGLKMPIQTANLGAFTYDDVVGIVNIRSYIERYMTPTWINQSGLYADKVLFDVESYVYVDYYEGSIVTDSSSTQGYFQSFIPRSIYSGKMIRLDFIITAPKLGASSYPTAGDVIRETIKTLYTVYVFPYNGELMFYCTTGLEEVGYLSTWYNSVEQYLEYDLISPLIISGEKGRLMGHNYVPTGNMSTNQYKLKGMRISNHRIDGDYEIFKEFMKG